MKKFTDPKLLNSVYCRDVRPKIGKKNSFGVRPLVNIVHSYNKHLS